jgi:NAD(P)H-dependent FMN reductase
MSGPILGICGSLRHPSRTRQALERALAAAAREGAETALLHGDAVRLPLCDGRPESEVPPEVAALRERAREAAALVLGSPEYCGTYSAVIKNVIEWLGTAILEKKVVGVVTVAEGASAQGSLRALRELCLLEGSWVIPAAAAIPFVEKVFTQPESPLSQSVLRHVDALGAALPEAIRRLRQRQPVAV